MSIDKAVKPLPQKEQLRLSLLQLVYRHDKDAPTIVDKAIELENYVLTGKKRTPAKAGTDR